MRTCVIGMPFCSFFATGGNFDALMVFKVFRQSFLRRKGGPCSAAPPILRHAPPISSPQARCRLYEGTRCCEDIQCGMQQITPRWGARADDSSVRYRAWPLRALGTCRRPDSQDTPALFPWKDSPRIPGSRCCWGTSASRTTALDVCLRMLLRGHNQGRELSPSPGTPHADCYARPALRKG